MMPRKFVDKNFRNFMETFIIFNQNSMAFFSGNFCVSGRKPFPSVPLPDGPLDYVI